MKNTARYEEMMETCKAWSKAKDEREIRKQEIINEYGWDSEELKAWNAEEEADNFPFTSGTVKAMRAFDASRGMGDSLVEMNDSCWENEWHDFVITLRELGVESMIVTCQSTGLMDDIYGYTAEGCTMQGLETITKDGWFGKDTVKGIRFDLN